MEINAGKIVKTVAKCSFYIASRAIGFGFFALALNIILLVFLSPEMAFVFQKMGNVHMDGGGPVVAVIFLFVLIIALWPITLMVLGFGVAFPVLYFIFGKKHGARKAIRYVVGDNREFIMEYTVDRLVDHVKKKTGVADRVDAAISKSKIIVLLPEYLAKLENMPGPMRLVYRLLMVKIDFGGMLTKLIGEQRGDENAEINFDALASAAKERTADLLEEKLLVPDLKWFWILSGINIALFVIVKIII
jgi:hypothetical protein